MHFEYRTLERANRQRLFDAGMYRSFNTVGSPSEQAGRIVEVGKIYDDLNRVCLLGSKRENCNMIEAWTEVNMLVPILREDFIEIDHKEAHSLLWNTSLAIIISSDCDDICYARARNKIFSIDLTGKRTNLAREALSFTMDKREFQYDADIKYFRENHKVLPSTSL